MELELLKQSWQNLDNKIQHSAAFSHRLIEAVISSRVVTTVDKIKKMYGGFYVVLAVETVALIAVLFGNPFDFRYPIQYVPYILLVVGVVIAFLNLLHLSRSIGRLTVTSQVDRYVKGIVSVYDRNKRFEKFFGMSMLSVGLLVPFSFLPQKLDRMTPGAALIDTGIMISVSLLLYFLAFKLGAFKNRHKDKLQKDLAEWEELKALAARMEK